MAELQSLGKGHSLYTVHFQSEWIFWQEEYSDSVMMREAGSNDLGHKQEDKRAGDHVDAGAVVVLCGHQGLCCFLHLRCKVWDYLYIPNHFRFIAPKASAEGACILSKLGDSYEVWLVTVVVVCVVTVMVWVLVYGSYIEVANMGVSGDTFWHIL